MQRCLTNKGSLDFLTDQLRERIRKHYLRCKYYSIYQNDLRSNCQCKDCEALDEREGSPSATVVHMANYVAERITKAYPDVNILTFAYMYTLKPPKMMRVHPNVMICYCTDETFCDKGVVVQRSPDLWSDLEAQYLANKGKFAYVLIRFWSDHAGRVTCALGASRCVQAFFEGKEVYSSGPIVEGRMVAPFWFDVEAKRGYNFLKVKIATNGKEKVFGQNRFRREWGVKLEVFRKD